MEYTVTAVDHNGNESDPSEILSILLAPPGDVNTDGTLNVFDIIYKHLSKINKECLNLKNRVDALEQTIIK